MTICTKCGQNLGFLSSKHNLKDGSVICDSCFKNWKNEQNQNKLSIINELLKKYADGLSDEEWGKVIWLHQNKSDPNVGYWNEHSLSGVEDYYKNMLQIADFETKKIAEGMLELLEDLEKMYKLISKKGIDTNYSELLSFLNDFFQQRTNKNIQKEIVGPYYKRIVNKYGSNVSKEIVIKEFLKTDKALTYKDEADYLTAFQLLTPLLDKFGLEYDDKEIQNLIKNFFEEVELEDFEKNLGSEKNITSKEEELSNEQFYSFKNGKTIQNFDIVCPVCTESFQLEIDINELPKTVEMDCPNCGGGIKGEMNAKTNTWNCEYCSKSFPTNEEATQHEKTCKLKK